jgi:hypothetical protein
MALGLHTGKPGALPLDPAGAIGPRTHFILFRDRHRLRDRKPSPKLCEIHTEDPSRAALTQAAARRRGPGAEPLVGEAIKPQPISP